MCANYMELSILDHSQEPYTDKKYLHGIQGGNFGNTSNILFAFTGHLPIYFLASWMKDMFAGH